MTLILKVFMYEVISLNVLVCKGKRSEEVLTRMEHFSRLSAGAGM